MGYKRTNVNDIINIASEEFAMKEIVCVTNKGKEIKLRIQPKLNDTKILELVASLVERSDYFAKNNLQFEDLYNSYFLLIKYFTDLKFNTYKSIKKQLEYELTAIKAIMDLGIFDQIMNNFDIDTMNKIQEALSKQNKAMQVIANNQLKQIIDDEKQIEEELKDE